MRLSFLALALSLVLFASPVIAQYTPDQEPLVASATEALRNALVYWQSQDGYSLWAMAPREERVTADQVTWDGYIRGSGIRAATTSNPIEDLVVDSVLGTTVTLIARVTLENTATRQQRPFVLTFRIRQEDGRPVVPMQPILDQRPKNDKNKKRR